MEIFDDRVCMLGEGPFYDACGQRVGWVDILGSRVLWRDLTADESGHVDLPEHVGAAVVRQSGELMVCLPDGLAMIGDDETVRPLADFADADIAAGTTRAATPMRSNDAKSDPAGRVWVSAMAYDATPGAGALYRLDGDRFDRVLGDVAIGNGPAWSPDHRMMYFTDSPAQCIDAFDYDITTGDIANRRTLIHIPPSDGMPDGMCVDSDGGIWVAFWGGWALRRYDPDGCLVRTIEVPAAQVTSCAFAGTDLDLLIITTAARHRPEAETGAGLTYVFCPGDVTGIPVGPVS